MCGDTEVAGEGGGYASRPISRDLICTGRDSAAGRRGVQSGDEHVGVAH